MVVQKAHTTDIVTGSNSDKGIVSAEESWESARTNRTTRSTKSTKSTSNRKTFNVAAFAKIVPFGAKQPPSAKNQQPSSPKGPPPSVSWGSHDDECDRRFEAEWESGFSSQKAHQKKSNEVKFDESCNKGHGDGSIFDRAFDEVKSLHEAEVTVLKNEVRCLKKMLKRRLGRGSMEVSPEPSAVVDTTLSEPGSGRDLILMDNITNSAPDVLFSNPTVLDKAPLSGSWQPGQVHSSDEDPNLAKPTISASSLAGIKDEDDAPCVEDADYSISASGEDSVVQIVTSGSSSSKKIAFGEAAVEENNRCSRHVIFGGEASDSGRDVPEEVPISDQFIQTWMRFTRLLIKRSMENVGALNEVWKQPESFVRKHRWNNPTIDIWAQAVKISAGKALDHEKRSAAKTKRGSKAQTVFHRRNFASYIGIEDWWIYRTMHFVQHTTSSGILRLRKLTYQDCVCDPNCTQRIVWSIGGMMLLLYDLITLPMQAFEFEENAFTIMVSWLGQVFWTLDIVFSFFTGVYINSELTKSFSKICQAYFKSWFVFDLILVLPLWIVVILGSNSAKSSSMSVFGYIRMLRFLRLLRLAKVERMLSDALARINSQVLLLTLGMVKLMVCLILTSHVNACIWFAIGKTQSGWHSQVEDKGKFYKYLASVHWTLTQFQGTSDILPGDSTQERIWAVCTVLMFMLFLCTFVSSLTNMMMEMQRLTEYQRYQDREVRSFLVIHQISASLSMRVRKYVEWKSRMQKDQNYDDVRIATILPQQLLMDLQHEIRGPLFIEHPFFEIFSTVYPRLTRCLCHHALELISPAPGELIFAAQEPGFRLYFIMSGSMTYTQIQRKADGEAIRTGEVDLEPGQHVSEPTLWMQWQHRGDLVVPCFSSMLAMSSQNFAELVGSHPLALTSCVLYARRYINGISRFIRQDMNDLMEPFSIVVEARCSNLTAGYDALVDPL